MFCGVPKWNAAILFFYVTFCNGILHFCSIYVAVLVVFLFNNILLI